MSTSMKVVTIITDREVAISGGTEAGIKPGDTLLILGRPIKITHPDTHEVLGEVVPTKAVVGSTKCKPNSRLPVRFERGK